MNAAIKERMCRLLEYPCSAEYLADVLGIPLAEIFAELARMERQGAVESKCLVTYRINEGDEKCAA
ncbi:hypothetical protein [Neisseria weaveri]|uniref:hypothetical protein n=1 Tax=Neisseria weaveri TaxID=28091 RepID=UPI000D3258DA|nr:hypothetical protein [Neisseria weaveri]